MGIISNATSAGLRAIDETLSPSSSKANNFHGLTELETMDATNSSSRETTRPNEPCPTGDLRDKTNQHASAVQAGVFGNAIGQHNLLSLIESKVLVYRESLEISRGESSHPGINESLGWNQFYAYLLWADSTRKVEEEARGYCECLPTRPLPGEAVLDQPLYQHDHLTSTVGGDARREFPAFLYARHKLRIRGFLPKERIASLALEFSEDALRQSGPSGPDFLYRHRVSLSTPSPPSIVRVRESTLSYPHIVVPDLPPRKYWPNFYVRPEKEIVSLKNLFSEFRFSLHRKYYTSLWHRLSGLTAKQRYAECVAAWSNFDPDEHKSPQIKKVTSPQKLSDKKKLSTLISRFRSFDPVRIRRDWEAMSGKASARYDVLHQKYKTLFAHKPRLDKTAHSFSRSRPGSVSYQRLSRLLSQFAYNLGTEAVETSLGVCSRDALEMWRLSTRLKPQGNGHVRERTYKEEGYRRIFESWQALHRHNVAQQQRPAKGPSFLEKSVFRPEDFDKVHEQVLLLREFMIAAVQEVVGPDNIKDYGISELSHIVNLLTNPSWVGKSLAAVALLDCGFVFDMARLLGLSLERMIRFCGTLFSTELMPHNADFISKFIMRIKHAEVFKQGGIIIMSFLSLGFFDNPLVAYLISRSTIESFMTKVTESSVVLDLLSSVQKLLQIVYKFSQSGSLEDLFPDNSTESIMMQLEYLRQELECIGTKDRDPYPTLAAVQKFVIKHSTSSNAIIRNQLISLVDLRNSIMRSLSAERAAPFGIIVTGIPGAGKTQFAKHFADFVAIHEGVPAGITSTMEYNNTKHQTPPAICSTLLINDYFSVKEDSAKCLITPVTLLQSLADTASVKLEAASIEDKERSSISPDAVVVTTNAYNYYCTESTSGVGKLDRRYWVAVFDVDKAAASELYAIAPEKVHAHVSELISTKGYEAVRPVLRYTIGRMHHPSMTDKQLVLKPVHCVTEFSNYREFFKHVRDLYVEHSEKRKFKSYTCTGCRAKLASELDDCNCHLFGTIRSLGLPPPIDDEEVKGIFARAFDRVFEYLLPHGGGVSVTMEPSPDVMDLLEDNSHRFEETATAVHKAALGVDHCVRIARSFDLKKVALGVAAYSVGLCLALKVLDRLLFACQSVNLLQAFVHDTPSVPAVVNPVETFVKNINPWLNGNLGTGWCQISYPGVSSYASLLTPTILVLPGHFFGDRIRFNDFYEGEPLKVNISFGLVSQEWEINSGGVWFGPRVVLNQYLDDCVAYVYVASLRCPLNEYVSKLHLGSKPVGKLRVGDKPATFGAANHFVMSYTATVVPGDCGLPIIDERGTFYGIHHAGTDTQGQGLIITREEFVRVKKRFQEVGIALDVQSPCLDFQTAGLPRKLEAEFTPHPRSDIGRYIQWNPGKSIIGTRHLPLGYFARVNVFRGTCMQTEMFPALVDKVEPCGKPYGGKAKLIDGEWLSPDLHRIGHMSMTANYNVRAAQKAQDDMIGRLDFSVFDTDPVGPISLYQSICGDKRNVAINPKDVEKAVGPTLRAMGISKNEAFKLISEGVYEIHPVLISQMEEWDRHLSSEEPIRPPIVEATIKDEVLPMAKVDKCRARYFYVMDCAVNLVMRQYLVPIIAFLVKQPQRSRMYTMVNATGYDWDELYHFLAFNGVERAWDSDHSAMDLHHQVYWEWLANYVYRVGVRMGYNERDAITARRCILALKAVVLIMNDNVYYSWGFLCSGSCATIFVNSLCGEALLTSIYYSRLSLPVGSAGAEIRSANVGDDQVSTLAPGSSFDPQWVQEDATYWGYVVTDGRKRDHIKFTSLTNITFLKRSFVVDGPRIRGPLERQSIYKSLAYCVNIKPKDVAKQRIRNLATIRSQLRECALHGEEFYNEIRRIVDVFFPDEKFESYESLLALMNLSDYKTWEFIVPGEELDTYESVLIPDLEPHSGSALSSGPGRPRGIGNTDQARLGIHHSGPSPAGTHEKELSIFSIYSGTSWNPSLGDSNETQSIMFATDLNNNNKTQRDMDSPQSLNDASITEPVEISAPVVSMVTDALESYSVRGAAPILRALPSTELSLADYFARPRLLQRVNLNGAAGHAELFQAWSALPTVSPFLNKWSLFRGAPTVKVMVTGSSQFIGLWRVFAVPVRKPDIYIDAPPSINTILDSYFGLERFVPSSQLPHVDIDLSTVGAYEMELPYCSNYPMLSIANSEVDYVLMWTPVNGLRMASGATPIDTYMEIYLSYHDVKLDVLVPQSGDDDGRLISSIFRYSSRIASKLNFPWATPAAKVLSVGANIAESLGYSRPPEEISEVMQRRIYNNQSVVSGQSETAYTLGADPRALTSIDPTTIPFGKIGDGHFRDFLHRECQVARDWDPLTYFTVKPLMKVIDSGSPTDYVMFPPFSYLAHCFDYYSGSFDVCMEIVSSPLIRGRLLLYVVPPGKTVPAGLEPDGSMISYVIDVVGTTCFEFNVPYMYKQDFMYTSGPSTGVFPRIFYAWVTPPVGPAATPVFPPVNLYMKANEDFQLGIPSTRLLYQFEVTDASALPGQDWTLQAYGSKAQSVFGEVIESVLELSKRKVVNLMPTEAAVRVGRPYIPGTTAGTPYIPYWTFATWFSLCYLGERGSFIWTVAPANNTRGCNVVSLTTNMRSATGLNPIYGRGHQVFTADEAIEVRLPSRVPTPFRTTEAGAVGKFATETLAFGFTADSIGGARFMSSVGDDYCLGGFLSTPVLRITD